MKFAFCRRDPPGVYRVGDDGPARIDVRRGLPTRLGESVMPAAGSKAGLCIMVKHRNSEEEKGGGKEMERRE